MNVHRGWMGRIGVLLLASAYLVALGDEEIVDFTDQMTELCEVSGLVAPPPRGWITVPIETNVAEARGCQMMRIQEDETLAGIMRVLSVELADPPEDAPAWQVMLAVETHLLGLMGFSIEELLWERDDVPIEGPGFGRARAVGFSSFIEGNDNPQEMHFLTFDKEPVHYIVSLLTPAGEVDEGTHYERNIADFGVLIRSFGLPGGAGD